MHAYGKDKIGKQKQLLFDNYIIEETQNLTLEVGQATKHGVVMEPTLPTDFQTGRSTMDRMEVPAMNSESPVFAGFFHPIGMKTKRNFVFGTCQASAPEVALHTPSQLMV